MTTLYKHKLYCSTSHGWVTTWTESAISPTTCPTNSADTIDSAVSSIVEIRPPDEVTIKEENIPTGGYFKIQSLVIEAVANQTTTQTFVFDIPINVISSYVVTTSDMVGDVISWTTAPNTTVGVLGASYTAKAAWTSQNYVVDDYVYYQGKNYKCKANTVSNEVPTNTTYWTPQTTTYTVSSTVVQYLKKGFFFRLTDGVNTTDEVVVTAVDTTNSTISSSYASPYSFSAASPTYVQMTVRYMDNLEIGYPTSIEIGQSKIGASYLPANTPLVAKYTNNSPSLDKRFVVYLQYLY